MARKGRWEILWLFWPRKNPTPITGRGVLRLQKLDWLSDSHRCTGHRGSVIHLGAVADVSVFKEKEGFVQAPAALTSSSIHLNTIRYYVHSTREMSECSDTRSEGVRKKSLQCAKQMQSTLVQAWSTQRPAHTPLSTPTCASAGCCSASMCHSHSKTSPKAAAAAAEVAVPPHPPKVQTLLHEAQGQESWFR